MPFGTLRIARPLACKKVKMGNHYIHYLTRKIDGKLSKVKANKFYALDQQLDEGFIRPKFHITRSRKGPATKIKVGDTIWIISLIKSPWGKTAPSLDAKIIVDNIQVTKKGYLKYIASKNSEWYHLCDMSECLFDLQTIDSRNKSKLLIENTINSIGIYLQSIRQLKNYEKIIEWSKHINISEYHFISYRIKDGTKAAFQKAHELLNNEKIIFWDRYCLPRRLSERREFICDRLLDSYLIEKLKKSVKVWGIESKLYAQNDSYSYKEFKLAKQLNKFFTA
jgi:hypothetical protein